MSNENNLTVVENDAESEFPTLKQIIEGAILAADAPLSIDRMIQLFQGEQPSRAQVRDALAEIEADCEGRGYELKQVASGYRFQVREEYGDWIGRLWEERPPRYTRALLETLALIAYKQPITRGDIEDVRGVAVSTNIIRTLLEREWIRIVGHRDVPGRPAIYATTRNFLDYFNLSSLEELPTLAEIKDLDGVNEELELEEEIIEPRTLEVITEEGEDTSGVSDDELNEVTDQVNTIQQNIKNLFEEDEPEDEEEYDDDMDLADDEEVVDTVPDDETPAPPADPEPEMSSRPEPQSGEAEGSDNQDDPVR